MLMSSVEFHVLCVEVGLDLGCHVVIGVLLGFTTQTQYQVQSSLLRDLAVHFCTCIVVRLYSVIAHSICIPNSCIFHTAKTCHLRCFAYTPRRLQ